MSLHQLRLDHKAVDVAVSKSGTRLAVLSDKDVAVYSMDITKRPVPKPSVVWRSSTLEGHVPRHVAFTGDEQIYVLTDSWDEEESYLWASQGEELVFRGPVLESGRISSLVSSVDYQRIYLQFQDGALYEVIADEGQSEGPFQASLVQKMTAFTPDIKVYAFDEKVRSLTIESRQDLIISDHCFWLDTNRRVVCQRSPIGPELHFVCSDACSSHLHDYPAPSQVRSPDGRQWLEKS